MAAVIYNNFLLGAASISFNVLVWGPASSFSDATAEKRRQIKELIAENGHKTFFSEELVFDSKAIIPMNVQERAQLHAMDLVVCLATDFGAIQEAQEFAHERPQYFLLWMSDRAKGKYSDKGLGETLRLAGRPPIFFADSDIASCVIATGSVEWVERWRYRKWQIDDQRRRLDEQDPKRGKVS